MYHQPSKQKQLAQRVTVYSIMSLAVIFLVSILVFFMLGYQFNGDDGRIEQGGLVQFDSRPTGAEVTIDGKSLGTRTTSKTTMAAGRHAITMKRINYQTWQKSIDVVPGSVLWLNYVRLIPRDLSPASVADLPAVTSTAVSENKKWMAVKTDASSPDITLFDLSQKDVKPAVITIPTDRYAPDVEGHPGRFSIDTWDDSGRYLLVKHTYRNGDTNAVEWLVVDAQQVDATKNITEALGINASQVVFSISNSKRLYALADGTIRRINLDNTTMSGPLVSQVEAFSVYKNTILYTTALDPKTETRTVGYMTEDIDKPRVIRSFADDGKPLLRVASSEYFDVTYTTIAYGDTLDIMKGDLPRSDSEVALTLTPVTTVTLPGGVSYLSHRTAGRFIVAQSPTAFVVRDLELQKTTTTLLHGTATPTRELRWLDGYHPWSDQDGTLRMYEFDGANQHDIMSVAPGFDATLSPNGTYLYGITVDDKNVFHLSRVKMIL